VRGALFGRSLIEVMGRTRRTRSIDTTQLTPQ
jgi:hypothetical protein